LEFRSTKAHVLFVDDDTRIAQMAEQALCAQGFDVTALTSPGEALSLFLTDPQKFDVVVLDHTMPGLSGLELARRISDARHELPILLLSGLAESISRSALKAAGIRECWPKPLPLSRLAELVHALLERTA
jgi:two-component system cell cycle sensor histidine kinase/response regulator CckA